MPPRGEGRPVIRTALVFAVDQALRRRRVYHIAAAPPATSSPPIATVMPSGAPVSGSVPPALTPPPGVELGETVVGLTPPGGTVSVFPVGVLGAGVGEVLGLTPP
jgi:hypothetical protein